MPNSLGMLRNKARGILITLEAVYTHRVAMSSDLSG
jgi:hypothetical protein